MPVLAAAWLHINLMAHIIRVPFCKQNKYTDFELINSNLF